MKIRTPGAKTLLTTLAALCLASSAHAASPALTDFENGMDGWKADSSARTGYSAIDRMMGDGSLGFHGKGVGFGWGIYTSTNSAFVGDYTSMKSLTIGLDVTVGGITGSEGGLAIPRELIVELRDYDKPGDVMGYSSVFFTLGILSGEAAGLQHYSVTIDDTASLALPSGWKGTGALKGWELQLPAGQSFQRILQDVDEIGFSTMIPGYAYAGSYFDISVDNIAISAVPEPSQWGMLAVGMGLLGFTARRKRQQQRLG